LLIVIFTGWNDRIDFTAWVSDATVCRDWSCFIDIIRSNSVLAACGLPNLS